MQTPHSLTFFLRSPVSEMTSPLFFESLQHDLGLASFKLPFLLAQFLVFKLFHARNHQHVHAAVIGAPLVKRRGVDTQLSVNVGHR